MVKSLGGYNNAATSYDFTRYFIVLPSEHIHSAIDVLLDALLHIQLPREEIERERNVVLEEIARKEDSPHGKMYDELLACVFEETPYARPVLGTAESLSEFNRDSIMAYRDRQYVPDRIHLAVSGQIEQRKIEDQVCAILEPSEGSSTNPLPGFDLPPRGSNRPTFEHRKDINQTYLVAGYRTPPIQGTNDEIALDLIDAVLSEGRSSRLVYRLVEETGLCSNVSAFCWGLDRVGMFGFEACYEEEDEPQVIGVLDEEIARIRSEPVPEDEFEKAKTLILTGFAFSLERVASLAGVLGRNSANGQLDNFLQFEDRVRAVSPAEAQEAFNRCCPEERRVLGFVRPE